MPQPRGIRRNAPARQSPGSGFTVIEMLVVLAVVAMLLSVVAPSITGRLDAAQETVLRQDLTVMRAAIDQFKADQARAPESLQELVSTGYLRAVPVDPITQRADTWVQTPAAGGSGIADVRSGAGGSSKREGAYATW